ncbi:tRNA (N6-isopentenyl adenosine(37)-C2)-methylthiotransferase MiaB [Patescibacteria group bacterium]|nr:tRNA (N6-isopentenyl adenosine(37)-C2)-methylthiotransferase MiaB [Patescibacteria group bacterium]
MNHSDSERIAGILELANYEMVREEKDADLVVINMCSVRESAVNRISGNFHKYKKYKIINSNFKTVITGCVLESDKRKFDKLFDLVIDIKEIEKLPKILKDCHSELDSESSKNMDLNATISSRLFISEIGVYNNNKQKILNQAQNDNDVIKDYFSIAPQYQSKITAYVPIMTGCNNFCTYCVVPYTRGREKSRTVREIIEEITKLIENGYKEIILLGQNVNSYKPDDKTDFPELLHQINDISGIFWIRFMTSHPKDISEELIKTITDCKKCTEHIHLALQSGDDEILKMMNRKYTTEHFLNIVNMIRNYIPEISITTDIIVGFPLEKDEQFQNTVKLMKKAKFDMAYINKYSPRAGTVSAKMDDDISWEEKKNRENILTELLKKTALENNKKYIGKVIDVLIEKTDDEYLYGKSRSGKNVKVELDNINQELRARIGKFMKTKITKAKPWNLEGLVWR